MSINFPVKLSINFFRITSHSLLPHNALFPSLSIVNLALPLVADVVVVGEDRLEEGGVHDERGALEQSLLDVELR